MQEKAEALMGAWTYSRFHHPRNQDLGSSLLFMYSWIFNFFPLNHIASQKQKRKIVNPERVLFQTYLLTWQPEPNVGELGRTHAWLPITWVALDVFTGDAARHQSGQHWELSSLDTSEVILHLLGILGSNQ